MSKNTTTYKCNECGKVWRHEWDDKSNGNDYTQCPNGCKEFDFDEVSDGSTR